MKLSMVKRGSRNTVLAALAVQVKVKTLLLLPWNNRDTAVLT